MLIINPKDAFNDLFTNIAQKLASQILNSSKAFETYINKLQWTKCHNGLEAFIDLRVKRGIFIAKVKKAQVLTMLVSTLLKKFFGMLCEPLIYLFQLFLENGVFPDDLENVKVTPIYKPGDSSDISNCSPMSFLPWFSKILERLMYNRVYKYLKEKIFLWKTVWFSNGIFQQQCYSPINPLLRNVVKWSDTL